MFLYLPFGCSDVVSMDRPLCSAVAFSPCCLTVRSGSRPVADENCSRPGTFEFSPQCPCSLLLATEQVDRRLQFNSRGCGLPLGGHVFLVLRLLRVCVAQEDESLKSYSHVYAPLFSAFEFVCISFVQVFCDRRSSPLLFATRLFVFLLEFVQLRIRDLVCLGVPCVTTTDPVFFVCMHIPVSLVCSHLVELDLCSSAQPLHILLRDVLTHIFFCCHRPVFVSQHGCWGTISGAVEKKSQIC